MGAFVGQTMRPRHTNVSRIESYAKALDVAPVREALHDLLADQSAWCAVPIAPQERATNPPWRLVSMNVAPVDVAAGILAEVPIPVLRPALENASGVDREDLHGVRAALHLLDQSPPTASPRARRVDAMVADDSVEGFEKLFAFVRAGMPWDDGTPAPTLEEQAAIDLHVTWALDRLLVIASAAPWDLKSCMRRVKESIQTGSLGAAMLEAFSSYPTAVREQIVDVLSYTWRPGAESIVRGIATSDPDEHIRDYADEALRYAAIGGQTNIVLQPPQPARPGWPNER